MTRPPKNKFEEAYLVFDKKIIVRVFDIVVPFVHKFTIGLNPSWYTEREYHIKKSEDMLLVEDDIKKQGYEIMKIEPSVRKIIDLCPKCHKRGIPKIEKKDTRDNRERTWRTKEETSPRKERSPEYWLVYTHSRHEKCRVRQYVNTPDPAYKKNDIDIEKYFFPWAIQHLKDGIIWYSH
ncbi:MAG: hypothetical protein ABI342_00120 [Nitrososphaera sp.]